MMNGDLLTDLDYGEFYETHRACDASLTVGVYRKEIAVSLGVLEVDELHRAVGFREKPVLSFPCSMGVYAVSPNLLPLIPTQGVFGFDDLMALCLARNIPVRAFPFDGLWLDIGRPEDYASAAKLFQDYRVAPVAAHPGRQATHQTRPSVRGFTLPGRRLKHDHVARSVVRRRFRPR